MKLKKYKGYIELVTQKNKADHGLKIGKFYYVQEHIKWVERNGNGGTTWTTQEYCLKVFDVTSKKLIRDDISIECFNSI